MRMAKRVLRDQSCRFWICRLQYPVQMELDAGEHLPAGSAMEVTLTLETDGGMPIARTSWQSPIPRKCMSCWSTRPRRLPSCAPEAEGMNGQYRFRLPRSGGAYRVFTRWCHCAPAGR